MKLSRQAWLSHPLDAEPRSSVYSQSNMPERPATEEILFTFVIEKEGSTRIEQVPGADVVEALAQWRHLNQLDPEMTIDDPTPVQGVQNVWCIGGHDMSGVFFLAHIVATSA
jgi:hypothetical protein